MVDCLAALLLGLDVDPEDDPQAPEAAGVELAPDPAWAPLIFVQSFFKCREKRMLTMGRNEHAIQNNDSNTVTRFHGLIF